MSTLIDGVKSLNVLSVRLALRDPRVARSYMSRCLQHYDYLMRRGLPIGDPVESLIELGLGARSPTDRLELPADLRDAGGTRLDELVHLARVTQALRPRKVFEIGTYRGRTTSVFVLNAPDDCEVLTLDLPPAPDDWAESASDYVPTDVELVESRRLGQALHQLGLEDRYEQILCDSLEFDPTPHEASVDLGFIDGAHAEKFVRNDTEKMAVMISDRGIVLWHDYGGHGAFRPLSAYLESVSRTLPIYRLHDTTLAWALGRDLKKLNS